MTVEEYRAALAACVLARDLLRQHDLSALLRAIDRADAVGAMLDPTLYRDRAHLMHEDRAVFSAALRFVGTWPRPEGA